MFKLQIIALISTVLSSSITIEGHSSIINTRSNGISTVQVPKQGSLIKLGFSGIFWNYIQSNHHKDHNLSSQCSSQLERYSHLIDSDDRDALQLLTASSHFPVNFFNLNYNDLEGYDTCVTIESTHYCIASVLPKNQTLYPIWFSLKYNTTVHIGLCLPSSCSSDQIESLITSVVETYDWEKVYFHGCQVASTFNQRLSKASAAQKGSLFLLAGIIGIVLFSSIAESFNALDNGFGYLWLRHFALQRTHRNLIESYQKGRFITPDYFRIAAAFLYLIIHAATVMAISNLGYLTEGLGNVTYLVSKWPTQFLNSDWIYSGIIYIGGTLVLFHLWPIIKPDTKLSTFVKLFIRKMTMFWPVIIVTIAMKIVLPLLGYGPVYSLHTEWRAEVCTRNWWYTLLHISNYLKAFDICLPVLWSMSAELHLFMLAMILVYLYKTWPRVAIAVNILAILVGLGFIFWIYYSNNFVSRLVGDKIDDWEKVEPRINHAYLTTENHVFTYSLAVMVNALGWLNPTPTTHLSKRTTKVISVVATILVIMQAFSSGIWNVLKIEGTPFWHATHALVCKLITSLSFSWIAWILLHEKSTVRFIQRLSGETTDDNQNKINDEPENKSSSAKLKAPSTAFIVFSAASRAAFFSHYTVFVWYFANQTKVHLDARFFIQVSFLVGLGYFSGLVFHYFVLGPYENIIATLKIRKTKKIN